MKDFIQYIIESTICLTAFYLTYRLFLRTATFYRFNRFFLLVGLVISILLPAVNTSYDVHIVPSPIMMHEAPAITEAVLTPASSPYNVWHAMIILYIIGTTICLTRNIVAIKKIGALIKRGKKTQHNNIEYIRNEHISSSFTTIKHILLNDENLSDMEKNIILDHEKIHIEQKHWLDLLCSECALLLHWFNPFMWLYVLAVKENHEYLVDKTILDRGVSRTLYQSVLVNQQIQYPVFSFTNSFKMSNYLNRFAMMKKSKSSPWKRLTVLVILPFLGIFVWASAKPNYIYDIDKIQPISANDSIKSKLSEFWIRGISTFDKATKALVIVDGEEKNIDDVNIDDIETFSIVKDESATAVFGERGKNGVILIGTKNGSKKNAEIAKVLMSEISDDNSEFWIRGISTFSKDKKALVLIDGKEGNMDDLSVDDIESFSILKDKSATRVFGERGKNGVVLIETEEGVKNNAELTEVTDQEKSEGNSEFWIRGISTFTKDAKTLVIIDGKEGNMDDLNAGDIETFSILKDEKETAKYGEKGKNGVILIGTKSAKETK